MKRVTGIGGIFFKSGDPKKINTWYQKHLGLKVNDYGSMFQGREFDDPKNTTLLQWAPFEADTTYFKPSEKEFMINYRVFDLEKLVEQLQEEGIEIIGEIQSFPYGKFAHIMDPEGNKIELWEPLDEGLDEELASQS